VFLSLVNCELEGINCLKNLPIEAILEAEKKTEKFIPIYDPLELFYPFTPIVDGIDIVQNPLNAFMDGNYYKNITIITGTVTNESLLFVWEAFPVGLGIAEYEVVLEALFPGNEQAILEQYPVPPNTTDVRPYFSIMGTDYLFTCPQRAMAMAVANDNVDLWLYMYNHTISFYEAWGPNFTECWTGVVCHASELPLVFQSATDGGFAFTPDEVILADQIGYFWSNLAKSGNPNIPIAQDIHWPQYNSSDAVNLQFNTPSFTESFIFKENCDFWDKIGYKTDFWDFLIKKFYTKRV